MSSPHRRAKSQNSISSTSIPQGPRFSPPKSPTKDSSPVRKPLHERSHSQTNQHAGPTIRIVQDPSDDIYQKYPVPSEPSQILPPPRHAPGYGFERPDRPGSLVSNGSQVANTIAKFEASRAQTPQPILSRRKGRRHSAATSMSEEDTLIASSFTPSSVRFSQGSTAPSSPPPEFEDYDKGLEVLEEEPPVQRQTIRAVPPSSSGGDSLDSRALTPKASAASFASPVPAAEPSSFSNAGNPSSVSVGRPLPQDDEHTPTPESEAGRSALACYTDYRQPVLKPQQSTDSFTFSDISYTSIEPTTSPTLHEASTASFASGIRLNYPVVRAASSNSLRADSQNLPNISSRMQDRSLIHNWSSQLSTIPSGSERDSRSIARASRSQSFGARSHSQESYGGNGRTTIPRRRGQTVSSAQSSSDNVSEGHTEFSAVPRPLFSPVSRGSSDNNSEHMDTISPLPSSIPLRMKNSGYLRRNNSVDGLSVTESRPGSSGRPGSASSNMSNFLANNIPAWARMYYQKGERISVAVPPESESSGSIRPGTSQSGRSRTPSESNFPLSIYRPRNRPRNRAASHTDTVSLADDVHSIDGAAYANGPQMYQLTGYSTPHLRTDQRGQALYSAWNAPSLDDDVHLTLFGRQNRQILLFCLGFLCPLTWMIASFLPLPLDPNSAATPTSSQADLEQQFAQNMGPANDKAFQKATWWRNLNRVMSGVGTLLIGVIVALAILASRM